TRTGFSATTTIKRTDFGVSKYAPLVGDDVTLAIEVEFTPK
ncbi:YceI family protein, partial [Stenotrophomonas maltophilia]